MILSLKVELRKPIYTVPYNTYSGPSNTSVMFTSNTSKTLYDSIGKDVIYADVIKEEIECFKFVNGHLEIIFKNPEDKFKNIIASLIPAEETTYENAIIIPKFWLDETDTDSVAAFNKLFSLEDSFIESRLVKENIA